MKPKGDQERYGIVAQGFHWLTLGLVAAMFAIAWYMTGLPLGPEKVKVYNLHKSIGVVIFTITLLRLAWRQLSPPPPSGMNGLERFAARASHVLLYLLLLLQPSVGILHSWTANFPVVVFGLFTIPSLMAPSEALKKIFAAIHYWQSWTILGLVALHASAALRHHFLLRNDVLQRMLPIVPRRRRTR
ncbi:MAG: cytochrome b [Alphaproteobacteria bacterium]|nr:cytochrome b [Pseudomonadota bacterium]